MRVGEVHHQTLGLVLANRPAASRPPLARGRGKMTRKFGALEENCASGEPSGGEGPEESARRSLPGEQTRPGESLGTRYRCGLKERPHLRAAREVEGVGEAGRRGRRRRAGHGGKRLPARPCGDTGAAGFLGDAEKSGVPRPPRLSRSPSTGLGPGRGRAGVGQGWKGKESYELLPPPRRIPSGSLLQKRSRKGREGRRQRWGAAGKSRTPFLGSPPGLATLRHWLGSVVWVVSARRRSRGIPKQRGRGVSGR